MNGPVCATAIPAVTLIAYWLGELHAASESELEEHLFGCSHCSERLRSFVQLADGIRRTSREGRLHAVLSASFVTTLKEDGLRVREYRLHPGGSVACTVQPTDDLVVAHLHAPLRDVRRLDVVYQDLTADTQLRMKDVAFDPNSDEIVLAPNVPALRQLTIATHRVRLVSVEDAAEREIGTYTFNHSRGGPEI